MSSLTCFTNSYIITNRADPSTSTDADIAPVSTPEGGMWWYTADNPEGSSYSPNVGDYVVPPGTQATTTAPDYFQKALAADLAIAKSNGCPQVTVLIHGLGDLFSNAINYLAVLGSGLRACASPYAGLVIAFDWPSYGPIYGGAHYSSSPYAFPPPAVAGTIRGNISSSVAAFKNLMTMLSAVASEGFQVNFVCHSEGNYMLMLGMAAQPTTGAFVDQVLLVAADINDGAFSESGATNAGQALPIASLSTRVTVYYSSGDDVLPGSEGMYAAVHNPSYPGRLGLEGPSSISAGQVPTNVIMVDCGTVINDQVAGGLDPSQPSHSSYFYIPQVLQDWSQTLTGVAPTEVVNRTGQNMLNGAAFAMNYVAPAPAALREQEKG